jgi:GT2 family glycosyltransferase
MNNRPNLSKQISVVMITRNRYPGLKQTLQQLQSLPETFPIIVVDNHSTDKTPELLKKDFPQVKVIALNENAGAIGRNIGVKAATTPYIAFCDDDSWWAPEALPRAIQYFEEYPKVGAIAGRILVKKEQKLDYVSYLHSISPLPARVPMPGPAILTFLGCGAIVRRSAYLEVGGYNERIKFSGEEWLLGIDFNAAGWGVTYAADVVGFHYPSKVRQMPRRYQMGARNAIWATWLRRPWIPATKKTLAIMKSALTNKNEAIGLLESLTGIPYVVRNRKVITTGLEEQIELLERQERVLHDAMTRQDVFQPILAGAPAK